MDHVLCPHAAHAAVCIIHSDSWQEHMQWVATVLELLRQVGLTTNPRECAVGWRKVQYLGYLFGSGQVCSQVGKTTAIAACLRPRTKKEVKRFLGLAHYSKFCGPH